MNAANPPGFAYASFLLGLVNNVSIANPIDPRLGKKVFGAYVQDSWKVTRKLTVDYGLRYDYSTYLQEEHGRNPYFSPTTPNPALGGILGAVEFEGSGPGHCNCNLAKNYPWAFGPRLGVAYQITPKTVFRCRLRNHLFHDRKQQQRQHYNPVVGFRQRHHTQPRACRSPHCRRVSPP